MSNTLTQDLKSWLIKYRQSPSAVYKKAALQLIKKLDFIRNIDELNQLLDQHFDVDMFHTLFSAKSYPDTFLIQIQVMKEKIHNQKQEYTQICQLFLNVTYPEKAKPLIDLLILILEDPILLLLNDATNLLNKLKQTQRFFHLLNTLHTTFPNNIYSTEELTPLQKCCELNKAYIRLLKHGSQHRIHSNETELQKLLECTVTIYEKIQQIGMVDIKKDYGYRHCCLC